MYVFRVEDGRLASALAVVEDNLARLRQLGLIEYELDMDPGSICERFGLRT